MRRQLLLILAVSLLSACSSLPKTDPVNRAQLWLQHQIAVSELTSWNINGRIGVKNDKQSGTVTLFWNQFLSNYELRFIAPLGQGTYILSGTSDGVVMKDPKSNIVRAETPEMLLHEGLGWDVHLDGLKYWIRGLPEPGINYSQLALDEKGRLSNMEQSGFNVSVSRYMKKNGISLPNKLSIKSDNIQLKVVIQNWDI